MKIIVNGQQAFGKAVLEALLDRAEEVVGVYCEPDKGERIDPIKEAALQHGLPLFQPKSFRKPEVWEQMASLVARLQLGWQPFVANLGPYQGVVDEALAEIRADEIMRRIWAHDRQDQRNRLRMFFDDER